MGGVIFDHDYEESYEDDDCEYVYEQRLETKLYQLPDYTKGFNHLSVSLCVAVFRVDLVLSYHLRILLLHL